MDGAGTMSARNDRLSFSALQYTLYLLALNPGKGPCPLEVYLIHTVKEFVIKTIAYTPNSINVAIFNSFQM